MSASLQGLSVAELDALIERAQLVRQETRERRRQELKREIEGKLKAEGFDAIDVLGAKARPKAEALPPKYMDKTNPEQTWSGKGRVPGWLQCQLMEGAKLDEFLITQKSPRQ